jgi:hypothetical protein
VTRTIAFRARRVLLVALVALVIGALAIALAPSSHHGHDATTSRPSTLPTSVSDGILARLPALFDR